MKKLFALEAEPELEMEKLARQKEEHVEPDIMVEVEAKQAEAKAAAENPEPTETPEAAPSDETSESPTDESENADDDTGMDLDDISVEARVLSLESTVSEVKGITMVQIDPGERVTGTDEHREEADDHGPVEASFEESVANDMERASYTVASTESFREIMGKEIGLLKTSRTVALEEWTDNPNLIADQARMEKIGSTVSKYSEKAGAGLLQLGKYLGTTVIPKVAAATYKGLVYAFVSLLRGMVLGSSMLDKYVKRRYYSFNNLRSRIQKLEHSLELVEKAHGKLNHANELSYRDTRTIDKISAGTSVNLITNVKVLNKFVEVAIDGLGSSVKTDISGIERIIAHSSARTDMSISSLLEIAPPLSGLKMGGTKDLVDSDSRVTSYVYPVLLPGNVVLTLFLPPSGEKPYEEWVECYKNSDIFLVVDRSRIQPHPTLPYMELPQLKELLTSLQKLCVTAIDHEKFYKAIGQDKIKLRVVYRKYFDALVSSKTKVTTKQSMVDLVILRNNFIDKVYLPAAIDIHDHTARTINACLAYVEKNLKLLSP